MDWAVVWVLVPVVAIAGGILSSIVSIRSRARIRELEIRERIAMIERGLVPPPEVDPQGFDRAMGRYERLRDISAIAGRRSPSRYRSAGVTMMGVGFGLMLLISVAGENPSAGIGVGGFLVIMGLAFFVNSLIAGERPVDVPYPSASPSTPQNHPPSFGGPEPPRTS